MLQIFSDEPYFVFLRSRVLLGKLDLKQEQAIVGETKQWLTDRVEDCPAYRHYLQHWGATDNRRRRDERVVPVNWCFTFCRVTSWVCACSRLAVSHNAKISEGYSRVVFGCSITGSAQNSEFYSPNLQNFLALRKLFNHTQRQF